MVLVDLPLSNGEVKDNRIAVNFANQILEQIRQLPNVGHNGYKIDASIGIAHFPKHSIDAHELIRMADVAMFEQKRAGASKPAEFVPAMFEKIDRIESLRLGLTQAIANHEFHLVYQPIIDAKANTVQSFEALLRWQWQKQMISPVEFIPVAEQGGSICEIGAWVLNEACKAAAGWQTWRATGVSVNVSTLQLLEENFIDVVQQALHDSGLAPGRLTLEITESVFCDDLELARQKLAEVCELGVTCSIDDFGTGYSSLMQIAQFPVNCIKVDRYFVANLDEHGASIIRAAHMMAKELQLKIVVEGLESQNQIERLLAMGIRSFQGYYFAKPLPEDKVEHFSIVSESSPQEAYSI